MIYLVGLGNPDVKYINTRHNIGWHALDAIADQYQCSAEEVVSHWNARVRSGVIADESVQLVYPQTYMNKSGETVRAILRDNPEAQIIIIHDDVALPVGTIRVSSTSGHAGHNGLKSIFAQTKRTDFVRFRLGVAGKRLLQSAPYVPTGSDRAGFVLGKFTLLERPLVAKAVKVTAAAVLVLLESGVQAATQYCHTELGAK